MAEAASRIDVSERPWQGELCQFFTRNKIVRRCLREIEFPKNLLSLRLLEPAAGQGAFILPLVPKLVAACRSQKRSFRALNTIIRAYEIDPVVAAHLRTRCVRALSRAGVGNALAREIAKQWVRNEDFLGANLKKRFSHIIGNPPYIRWDAIPVAVREEYKVRFSAFRKRADLYVAFIEHSLRFLTDNGQLAFLCPGTWTRNVYGADVRSALTTQGHLKSIVDLSELDSFEKQADAYPHFFVFQKGGSGPTKISAASAKRRRDAVRSIKRRFEPSSAPLLLVRADDAVAAINAARGKFPSLEHAGCEIRVGSATGCNSVFLGPRDDLPVESSRLLPFVNAGSIAKGKVTWANTSIVNVFDDEGALVELSKFPRLKAYLHAHKKALKNRAKASKSENWWRTIDVLHPDWHSQKKLLVVDISSTPVIGLDKNGFCAGSGVYQIKSSQWPLPDLLTLLSAGILGLFVSSFSAGAANGFHRFQKKKLAAIPIPKWDEQSVQWRDEFQSARSRGDSSATLALVADLYGCSRRLLKQHLARDWSFLFQPQASR